MLSLTVVRQLWSFLIISVRYMNLQRSDTFSTARTTNPLITRPMLQQLHHAYHKTFGKPLDLSINPWIENLNAVIDSSQAAMGFFAHFREVYEQRASRESLGLVARLPMHAAQHHHPIAQAFTTKNQIFFIDDQD